METSGTRAQASGYSDPGLGQPTSRRFAEVSLTLRLHTAPPLGFLHTRGHLECGTFGQAVPDPGVMRLRRVALHLLPGFWFNLVQTVLGFDCAVPLRQPNQDHPV